MPSNHLILCHPFLLLPSIFPSIRVFSNESALRIRWPKYWSFNFNISPSSEHPGLISFRRDWLDLLAVQGTLRSLLQYHSAKASILLCSAFFIVQLAHPYMTTGLVTISYQAFIYKGTAPSTLHRVSILIYPLQQYYETGTNIIPILQMRKVRFTDVYYFTQCYTLVSTKEELDFKSRFESLRSHVWPFIGNLTLHRKEEQGGKKHEAGDNGGWCEVGGNSSEYRDWISNSRKPSSLVFPPNKTRACFQVPSSSCSCHLLHGQRTSSLRLSLGFLDGSAGKESACNVRDIGDAFSIPGSGRFPGEGNGNSL